VSGREPCPPPSTTLRGRPEGVPWRRRLPASPWSACSPPCARLARTASVRPAAEHLQQGARSLLPRSSVGDHPTAPQTYLCSANAPFGPHPGQGSPDGCRGTSRRGRRSFVACRASQARWQGNERRASPTDDAGPCTPRRARVVAPTLYRAGRLGGDKRRVARHNVASRDSRSRTTVTGRRSCP
jgi:hypothetical protein